jgi:hypothetical protein
MRNPLRRCVTPVCSAVVALASVALAAQDQAAAPAAAQTAAASSSVNGDTCHNDGVDDVKKARIMSSFMPNREEAKIGLNGSAQSTAGGHGAYNKLSSLRMRWVRPGALSWFCGDSKGKRAFEPDTKPEDNGTVDGPDAEPRWSGNWANHGWVSNLPKPYKDDLACGNNCGADPFKVQTYPDFSIGSGNARALVYGKLYTSRFVTDTGDRDYGSAYIRGQQNVKASSALEHAYCRGRSFAAGHFYLDRYCFFGRGTYKVMTIALRNAHYVHRAYDWTANSVPAGVNEIGTGRAGGGP